VAPSLLSFKVGCSLLNMSHSHLSAQYCDAQLGTDDDQMDVFASDQCVGDRVGFCCIMLGIVLDF